MPPKKDKKINLRYEKKDELDHILHRPEMYIGSMVVENVENFVFEDGKIIRKKIQISDAFLRIFIEPLSNCIDNLARSKKSKNKMTTIKIEVDQKTGSLTFLNDGDFIPIERHPIEKCYNHSMLFGQLRTSSNFNDDEDRTDISGVNGLGGKVSCIFSKTFTVEGVDPVNGKYLKQVWKNNMRETSEPLVKESKLKKGYTKVSFVPDYERFKLDGISDDLIALFKAYAVDTAMLTKVKVYFNGEQIPVKNLVEYSKFFCSDEELSNSITMKSKDCEVVLTPSLKGFEFMAFSNGIRNPRGGVHVDAWAEAIFRPIVDKLNKPKKPQINISDVRQYFRLFVVASLNNPRWDSQCKYTLKTPSVETLVKPSNISNILKWEVVDRIEDIIKSKEFGVLKKLTRKQKKFEAIDMLDSANFEGTKKGYLCNLLLVEGESAKNYAVWGLKQGVFGAEGRNCNGIFTLKGKIRNIRDLDAKDIEKNEIITSLIKATGVQVDIDYTKDENWKKLRYGRVVCLCDADVDGIHITSLIQNFFHYLFPTLLQRKEPYITSMQTPIVKVIDRKNNLLFYNEKDFKDYVQNTKNKSFKHKYLKGLGSSTQKDVIETFGKKMVKFTYDEKCHSMMIKAFNKKVTDSRKEWIGNYDPDVKLFNWDKKKDMETIDIKFSEYIDKELVKYSFASCERSIPNIMDGLKESQRKILYVSLKRDLKEEIKVSQLAGSVSEKANYHHGEKSLEETICGMASSYVGSNNIPLLTRGGNFGTRTCKKPGSARYIFTKLDSLTRLIFRPEDDVLLDYIVDDGDSIEPRYYVPIIPMVLVNGSEGIGTGWSSSIPCYNPLDVIEGVKRWVNGDEDKLDFIPWYMGFNGEIIKKDENKFQINGTLEHTNNGIIISEIPVSKSIDEYKTFLDKLREEKKIDSYDNQSTAEHPNFTVVEAEENMICDLKTLKLIENKSTTNMVLHSETFNIKKYNCIQEILEAFCTVRLEFYQRRKKHILNQLERELKLLGNKKRFLIDIRDGNILLFIETGKKRESRSEKDIEAELEEKKYDKVDDGYEYLLGMKINSITSEKINKLAKDIDSTKKELGELEKTSEKQLWLNDLKELEEAYPKFLKQIEEENKEHDENKDKNGKTKRINKNKK